MTIFDVFGLAACLLVASAIATVCIGRFIRGIDPDAARPLPGAHYQPATYRDDAGHEAWIRELAVDFEPEEGKR